jgi:hypothetical protein
MEIIKEVTVSPYTNFAKWFKKRVKANRAHFLQNLDLDSWASNKFIQYKNVLYFPLRIDWPDNRDYGILYVKYIGDVRKLQSGPSTTIIPLDSKQIKIQVSHEVKRKKEIK